MSDRVLVVLDRKEAAQLRVMVRHETGCRYMADDRYPCDCLRGRLFAALDRDREELVAVIDRAVEVAQAATADLYADDAGPVPDDELEIQVKAVAGLFIEHGRQQEREAIEARKREYTMRAVKLLTDEEIAKAEARGAAAEKARWEALTEQEAVKSDRAAERHAMAAESAFRSGLRAAAAAEADIATGHARDALLFRSLLLRPLLTEQGENGE